MSTMDEVDRLKAEVGTLIRRGTRLTRTRSPQHPTHTFIARQVVDDAPDCAHGPMRLVFQVDRREALHEESSGVYCVFECAAPLQTRFAEFRAGDSPCTPRVCRGTVRSAPSDAEYLVASDTADYLPPDEILGEVASTLVDTLEALELATPWERTYFRIMDEGFRERLYAEHLGGWHVTNHDRRIVPPPCPDCGAYRHLVIQIEWGDGNWSLWTCDTHPEHSVALCHK